MHKADGTTQEKLQLILRYMVGKTPLNCQQEDDLASTTLEADIRLTQKLVCLVVYMHEDHMFRNYMS
jgi:hypothetical protein